MEMGIIIASNFVVCCFNPLSGEIGLAALGQSLSTEFTELTV